MKTMFKTIGIITFTAAILFLTTTCEGPMGPEGLKGDQGLPGGAAELEITLPALLTYSPCIIDPLNTAGLVVSVKFNNELVYIIPDILYKLFWNGAEIENGNTEITEEPGTKTITIVDIVGREATFEIFVEEHDFEYTSTTEPVCYGEGFDTYTCSRCPKTEKRNFVDALGCDFVYTSTTAPTCEDDGYDTFTCSLCSGIEKRNFVGALGCNFVYTSTTAPTCEDDGYDTYTCSRCSDTEQRIVNALGHNFVYTSTTAPTCEDDGYDTYTCSRCSDTEQRNKVSSFGGHKYGDWTIDIITSLTSAVSGVRICANVPECKIETTGISLDDLLSKLPINTTTTPYHLVVNIDNLRSSDFDSGVPLRGVIRNNSSKFISLDLSGSTFISNTVGDFNYCDNLINITLPSSVTVIGDNAFNSCSNLTSINILSGVTIIESFAFEGCSSLTNIIIPSGVTLILFGAFEDCHSLESVTFQGTIQNIYDGSLGYPVFPGNLREVFYATDPENGTPGTYTATRTPDDKYSVQWTLQP